MGLVMDTRGLRFGRCCTTFLIALVACVAPQGVGNADAEAVAERYISELRQVPGAFVKTKAHHIPGWGVAMVANEMIYRGETIFDVPFNSTPIIGSNFNMSDKTHAEMHRALPSEEGIDVGCLALLVERSRGVDSPFHEMIKHGFPSEPERSLLLKEGDDEVSIYHAWHIAVGEGLYDWRACAKQLRTLRWAHLLDGMTVNDIAKWAVSCWQTRSFEKGLVPALSFFNHHWDTSAEMIKREDRFILEATKSIRQDEQIFISYGRLSNLMLLAQYGFTMSDNPLMEAPVSFLMLTDIPEIEEWLVRSYRDMDDALNSLDLDVDQAISNIWIFRADYISVVSDDLLWQTRVGAAELTREEVVNFEKSEWRNITSFYSSAVTSLSQKERTPKSVMQIPLRWMRSDQLVCFTWKKFCVEVKHSLTQSIEHHLLRLQNKNDKYVVQLVDAASTQLLYWDMCSQAMQVLIDQIDNILLTLADQEL